MIMEYFLIARLCFLIYVQKCLVMKKTFWPKFHEIVQPKLSKYFCPYNKLFRSILKYKIHFWSKNKKQTPHSVHKRSVKKRP